MIPKAGGLGKDRAAGLRLKGSVAELKVPRELGVWLYYMA